MVSTKNESEKTVNWPPCLQSERCVSKRCCQPTPTSKGGGQGVLRTSTSSQPRVCLVLLLSFSLFPSPSSPLISSLVCNLSRFPSNRQQVFPLAYLRKANPVTTARLVEDNCTCGNQSISQRGGCVGGSTAYSDLRGGSDRRGMNTVVVQGSEKKT